MVFVNPQYKFGKDRVLLINYAVAVAAVFRLIKLGEGQETVRTVGWRLSSEVTEQLLAIVDPPVLISVEREKCIARPCGSPTDLNRVPGSTDIELHAILG